MERIAQFRCVRATAVIAALAQRTTRASAIPVIQATCVALVRRKKKSVSSYINLASCARCVNGACVTTAASPPVCVCQPGWFGMDCSVPEDEALDSASSPSHKGLSKSGRVRNFEYCALQILSLMDYLRLQSLLCALLLAWVQLLRLLFWQ